MLLCDVKKSALCGCEREEGGGEGTAREWEGVGRGRESVWVTYMSAHTHTRECVDSYALYHTSIHVCITHHCITQHVTTHYCITHHFISLPHIMSCLYHTSLYHTSLYLFTTRQFISSSHITWCDKECVQWQWEGGWEREAGRGRLGEGKGQQECGGGGGGGRECVSHVTRMNES